MNVTFLAEKLDRTGGSSFSLDLIARQLSERGHSIKILTTNLFHENNVSDDVPYEVTENITNSDTQYRGYPKIKNVLSRYEEESDIYHIFNPQHLSIAGLYRKNGTVPTVGRLNAYDAFCTNPSMMDGECYQDCSLTDKIRHDNREITEKLAKAPQYVYQHVSPRFINNLDRLFAISPAIKEVYSHNYINEELVDVVPNFYDPEFTTQSESNINILSDEFMILYVGRIRPEKGVDLLVDAAKQMDMTNAVINIVGEGVTRDKLEAKVEEYNLTESVQFHGWVDQSNLSNFYNQSDVFVHPGRWPEPFGRTILEALQCDCPPVVSDVGAPPWVIRDVGEIFEPNNSTALSDKLYKLQESPKLSLYKSQCSERVDDFNPEQIISKIESKYKST